MDLKLRELENIGKWRSSTCPLKNKTAIYELPGPRHSSSGMKTPRWGCSQGERRLSRQSVRCNWRSNDLLDQRPVTHRHKALDDSVDGIFVGRWKKLAAESAHEK